MNRIREIFIPLLMAVLLLAGAAPSGAALFVQCPGDVDGDLIPDATIPPGYPDAGLPNPDYDPDVVCVHVTGGDGFVKMGDGRDQYMFSFGLVDHTAPGFSLNNVVAEYGLKARLPAPLITVKQGQELYLTMTNVGMIMRPDLFDPHSIHWHGFPNAAPIFDGLPEPSPTANMGASFTYYYNAAVPGTYFYHCHVEAAEHMQMGMIGNIWIYPSQDGTEITHDGRTFTKFAYNDTGYGEDGYTGYNREYPLQLIGFDSLFHDAHLAVQPLPFADMHDDYSMINGRGYPDTVNPNPIANREGFNAQTEHSIITAASGERVLLRVSNVSTTHNYSIATTLGVPMKVVGRGAAILRGPTGLDTSMTLNVLHVGGGQAFDVLLDTEGVPAGTYFLYATTLENLANGPEDRGGLMTEIRITN